MEIALIIINIIADILVLARVFVFDNKRIYAFIGDILIILLFVACSLYSFEVRDCKQQLKQVELSQESND